MIFIFDALSVKTQKSPTFGFQKLSFFISNTSKVRVLAYKSPFHHLSGKSVVKLFILCIGTLILTLLTGCAVAPADAPRFSPAPPAPEGYATVYMYRLGAPPYSRDIKLSIASKPVINAPEQAYTWMFIRAGTHTLIAEWPSDFLGPKKWPDATATQTFEIGESYYFRIAGNVGLAGGGLFSSGGMVLTSSLARRPPDAGKAELVACCRYMQPASERLE